MTMTFCQLDEALREAVRRKWSPMIFKVHVGPGPCLQPTAIADRRGIPIDMTSQRSHLLCEGGRVIMIDGEW